MTNIATPITPANKRLLDYLPAIYHDGDQPEKPNFLALFLQAFEAILFGGLLPAGQDPTSIPRGLEEEVAAIPSLFDPMQTPEEFLPWLAGWAALSFHPDLTLDRRRNLLAHIIPLYRIRGTRKYLEDVLTLCLDTFVSVTDADIPELQIDNHSTIGYDTYIGGGPPHFFSVRLIAPGLNQQEKKIQEAIARSIIDQAKPAHTAYELSLVSPVLQLGIHSSVGMDTVLGPSS